MRSNRLERAMVSLLAIAGALFLVGAGDVAPKSTRPESSVADAAARVDAPGTHAKAQDRQGDPQPTLYVVGTAHLDTQWLWTIQDTIRDFIPSTLHDNFALFETDPSYVFSFEGAFRYMLAKEYVPKDYARLAEYVAKGRWRVAGSAVDAGDVNIPAPESLIRHVLYGNGFFRREFGRTSADIYLPDCFGFGWALPTVAAHCGLRGFSTQKLTWGSSVGIPFDVGLWEGVDGSAVIAALNPGDYVSTIREDLSESPTWREKIDNLGRTAGAWVGYRYFGTGDQGGAPDAESVSWLERSIVGKGPVRVRSAASDQLYRDLPQAESARLPRYRGELLMTRHGTGCYTSQGAMKRWNRKNEQAAAAAERASVIAAWLGGASYPKQTLRDAWVRFLWHHHHDDVTGTSTPLAYPFSWNDEILSMKTFGDVQADGAGAVARALDTRSEGAAIVVFNPLSFDREDSVDALVRFDGPPPRAVRVFGPDGREVPSQTAGVGEDGLRVLFLAKIPSIGFAVYDVRRSEAPCAMATGLRVSERSLENERYRVRLGEGGDVASVFDKLAGRELLAGPATLQLFTVASGPWPEWEIGWSDVSGPARGSVEGPATVRVVERGPARVSLEVSRQAAGSIVTQRIRLAAGGSGDRVEIDTSLDWRTPATLLKAAFPLTVRNPKATYDLGLGTIERGNNTETLYEVPAQQWADITAPDGTYGVAVLDDGKYGWDKPSDGVLRLSLVHAPPGIEKDFGRHRFLYALAGHRGDWREGRISALAARVNQPLVAFQTPPHTGFLGRRFSMLRLSTLQVAVSALKQAEDSDELIVRLFEQHGRAARDVTLTMGAPILAAREVTGAERPLAESLAVGAGSLGGLAGKPSAEPTRDARDLAAAVGPLRLVNGTLRFSMEPYKPRTFALRVGPPPLRLSPPTSIPVPLDFDADVISPHDAPGDGDFDGSGHALPAELLPETLVSEGIRFTLGPKAPRARNALTCRGQSIDLGPYGGTSRDARPRHVYVLAAAHGADRPVAFRIDGREMAQTVHDFTGFVGQSQSLVVDGRIVPALQMDEPYIKDAPLAWVGTHRHDAKIGAEPYVFCYLFKYRFDLSPATPRGKEATEEDRSRRARLTLPDDGAIRILAITLVEGSNDDAVPASEIVDRIVGTRIRPRGGLSIEPVRVTLSCDRTGASIHYTVNGPEPTSSDPLYEAPFTIDRDATVRARAFFGSIAEDDVAVRRFTFERPRPPASDATHGGRSSPGLLYEYFEGAWRDLSGLASSQSVRTGSTETITPSLRRRDADFGLRFRGDLDVPRDGVYTFYTRSDDGSSLRIGDVLVVDNDGLHGARERSGQIALGAGHHPIEVLFFQRGGDIDLDIAWEGPGFGRQSIPSSALSHAEPEGP